MRFAHFTLLYGQLGCKMVVFPGAFNTTTGPLHWELLLRARALDSQVPVGAIYAFDSAGDGFYSRLSHPGIAWFFSLATCLLVFRFLLQGVPLPVVNRRVIPHGATHR